MNCGSCSEEIVFKFVSVPAKWIRMARQNILNIYTDNEALMPVSSKLTSDNLKNYENLAYSLT